MGTAVEAGSCSTHEEGITGIENGKHGEADNLRGLPSGLFGDQHFGGDTEQGVQLESYSKDTVVLTLEFLSDGHAKLLVFLLRLGYLFAVVLLGIQIAWKIIDGSDAPVYNRKQFSFNTAVGVPSVAGALGIGCFYLFRIYKTWKQGMRWSRRRKRYCILGGISLLFEFLQAVFFLSANIRALTNACTWVLPGKQIMSLIAWLCTAALLAMQLLHALTLLPLDELPFYKGNLKVGLDLPSKVYVIVFFICFSPLLIVHFLRFTLEQNWFDPEALCQKYYNQSCTALLQSQACLQEGFVCVFTKPEKVLTGVFVGIASFEMVVYFAMIIYSRRVLQRSTYKEHRISYMELGFQLKSRITAALFFFVSFLLPTLIYLSNCSSMILTVMGHPSFQAAMAAVVIFQTALCTPADASSHLIKLHAWLQSPAWIEDEVPAKLGQRPFQGEPCFCYETALKLFYYCNLIYGIEEEPDSEYSLDVALGLYKLTNHRVLKKKKFDTKCLLTWDAEQRIIVLAFRGTASMANVLADLEVWRAAHPPERGKYFLGSQPMVHRGFLETWQTSGLKADVMELLKEIMSANPEKDAPWRVLTTGHSLGGALAHLASYDIAKQEGSHAKLTCITFGAPRPGNHAFAHSFASVVPDAWDIFHADDAVSCGGKFIFMYKRAAKTVIVSREGDLIVRPTYAEAAVRRSWSSSLLEHFLARYARSLVSILRAEIKQSRKKAGASGADVAAENKPDPASAHSLQELLACKYVQTMLTTTMSVRADSLKLLTGRQPSIVYLMRRDTLSSMTISGNEHRRELIEDDFDQTD